MNDYLLEVEATKSLLSFLEQAEKCCRLFEQAGMALPEPLRRLSGDVADEELSVDLSATQRWRPKSYPWKAPR